MGMHSSYARGQILCKNNGRIGIIERGHVQGFEAVILIEPQSSCIVSYDGSQNGAAQWNTASRRSLATPRFLCSGDIHTCNDSPVSVSPFRYNAAIPIGESFEKAMNVARSDPSAVPSD